MAEVKPEAVEESNAHKVVPKNDHPVEMPGENQKIYHTARMNVGPVVPIEEPVPMDYHPYHPVLIISDDDEEIDEAQHDEDLLDVEEDAEEENDEPVADEFPPVMEEDYDEAVADEFPPDMEEEGQYIVSLIHQAIIAILSANEEVEIMKDRWIAEAQRSYLLELALATREAEMIQLQEKLEEEREDRCRSYWKINKEVEEFPVARNESGYEINRSVVSSMLHKEYVKAKNII